MSETGWIKPADKTEYDLVTAVAQVLGKRLPFSLQKDAFWLAKGYLLHAETPRFTNLSPGYG